MGNTDGSPGTVMRGTGAATPPSFSSNGHHNPEPVEPSVQTPTPPAPVPLRPIPFMGWQKAVYVLGKLFGLDIRPKRGRKEISLLAELYEEASTLNREFDEAARRIRVRRESIERLRELTDHVPALIFAFFNTKGAGATTTTTVNTSAMFAEIARVVLALIDGNPAAGTCAARLGKKDGDTITIQALAQSLDKDEDLRLRDFKSEISKARPSKNGVRIISADSIIDEHRRLSGNAMSRVLELFELNSEYVSIDTGNDIGDTVARVIAAKAHTFVFTANVAVPDSLRKLSTSMETLRRLGFEEKVNHSVVVISNLPAGKELDDYRKFLNEVDFEDKVTRKLEHQFQGKFLGVWHDPYVALDRVVDLEKMLWETQQAYIQICIAILEQAQAMKQLPVGIPTKALSESTY